MEENVNVRGLNCFLKVSGLICDRWLSLGCYSTSPSLLLTGKWHIWFDLTEHYVHLWSVACVGGAIHTVVVTLNRKTGRDFHQRTCDFNSKGSWAMLLPGSVYLHVDDKQNFLHYAVLNGGNSVFLSLFFPSVSTHTVKLTSPQHTHAY